MMRGEMGNSWVWGTEEVVDLGDQGGLLEVTLGERTLVVAGMR